MRKAAVIAAAVTGVVLLGGSIVFVRMIRHGFSAHDEPTVLEAFMARRMRHLAVPSAARDVRNPVPASDGVLAAGRAHFADHCATCHGNDGKGQTQIGRNLYPKAPDMSARGTQSLSDGELYYIIKNGVRLTGMPAWETGTAEGDQQSWHLVHFIRHLPMISEDELREMEKLNPRSPDELAEEETERRFLHGEDVP